MLQKREELRRGDAAAPPEQPRRSTGELTRVCAAIWNGMDADARAPWEAEAAARKAAEAAAAAAGATGRGFGGGGGVGSSDATGRELGGAEERAPTTEAVAVGAS